MPRPHTPNSDGPITDEPDPPDPEGDRDPDPRPAWDPEPLDDLDGYETGMSRFLRRVAPILGVVVALALVVPFASGLVQSLVFDRAGDRVVEQLEGDDLDAALTASVLLVAGTECSGVGSVTGTAFAAVVDGRAVLLTNAHVVDEVRSVGLRTLDGVPGPRVQSWRLSPSADVAVLALEDPSAVPPALRLANDGAPAGTPVRTVGFPAGLPYTTDGTVAATDDQRVEYDMRVSPGASGSPVLDASGTVVGQVFATSDGGRTAVGTPADRLIAALGDLGPARDGC